MTTKTIVLPTPGQEPWDATLNTAIQGLDTRLTAVEVGGGGAAAAGRYVPVVVFNGESNSGGYGQNELATAGEVAPRPAVQIFDNVGLGSFLTLDIGTNNLVDHSGLPANATHGWELGLANSVEAGQWWDGTVYLVKTGQGASKIADWNEAGAYYQKFLARTRGALSLLRGQGKVPLVYLWYTLGINDALAGTPEATWKTEVEAYFVRVRKELGYVPIFFCRMMASSSGATFNDSVDAIAAADNMVFPIDATGATTRDANHWDYAGMKVMSGRLVAATHGFGQHEGYNTRRIDLLGAGGALAPPVDLPSLVRTPAAVTFVEGGAGGAFTVALDEAPVATVTVAATASGGNAACAPPSLVFTTGDWATTQTVTVTSPDDGTPSGDRASTVTLSSPGVSGPATVAVTITDAPVGPSAPVVTVLPAISGATTLGAVLTCSQGSWTQSPTSYAYQWKRGGTNLAGETATTHTVVAGDQGTTLTCAVTATNAQGSTTATSAGRSVPAAPVVLAPVEWGSFVNTDSPEAGVVHLLSTTTPIGAMGTDTLNLAAPWEVEVEYATSAATQGIVVFLDDDATQNYTWNAANVFLAGAYHFGDVVNAPTTGSTPNNTGLTLSSFPCTVKMARSGDDVQYRVAYGAGAYGAVFYTNTGVLAGKTTGYLKCLFAVPSAGQQALVRRSV